MATEVSEDRALPSFSECINESGEERPFTLKKETLSAKAHGMIYHTRTKVVRYLYLLYLWV
jgi:hypothetical protein